MTTGTVKFFNENKGYGFIQPDDGGKDAFVHITAVERSGMRTLRENQRVSYDLQEDGRGKMAATNLRAADDAAPSASAEAEEVEAEEASDAQEEDQEENEGGAADDQAE
jgi:cold shock protein